MAVSLIFRKNNPRRPVDWRWQLSEKIVAGHARVLRSSMDRHLQQAVILRRQLERSVDEQDHLRILHSSPDLYEAWALHDEDNEQELKWELEARLLTRQSYTEIAEAMPISAKTVDCYEGLFFNVRDRLDSPSYITQVVFGRSVQVGLAERAYDLLWKMYGYWGGPHVLGAFLFRNRTAPSPEDNLGINAYIHDDITDNLRLKAAITMRTMPVNWETQPEIMKLYLQMLEIEKNAGEGHGATETMFANISTLFDQIPWTKHRPGIDQVDSSDVIGLVDETGVSLRAAELAVIGTQKRVPQALQYLIETIKFPETGNAKNAEKA